ncbi:MAG: hypothetical protein WCW35_11285 [Bacteroidota bacterium]|jgi:hypothetical protein
MKFFILSLMVIFSMNVYAQDTSAAVKTYNTFGFQFSLVSGTGISYGKILDGKIKLKGTGGFITSDDKTKYSFGFDVHYFLSKGDKFEVTLGPSLGFIGGTNEDVKSRLALATSMEVPFNGDEHYNNLCGGIVLYYPTFYMKSGDINVTAGIYIVYNF